MNFKKLALAAAVAVAPMSALALEPMQDEALSAVTGQDGISMTIDADITTSVWIEDTDGFVTNDPAAGDKTTNAGFIVLGSYDDGTDTWSGFDIDLANTQITIDSGATGTGAGTGALNIGISTPSISLTNLSLGVQGSSLTTAAAATDASADVTRVGDIANTTEVLSIGALNINSLDLSLQLGGETIAVQGGTGAFLTIGSGSVDITLEEVNLYGGGTNPAATGATAGSLYVDEIALTGLDLDGTQAYLHDDGLQVVVGSSANDIDVSLSRVALGGSGAASIGNVYLTSLDLSGTTVTISGH